MNRQALVVGLGQFGTALAISLAEKGVEVLACDQDEDLVRAVAPIVAEAIRLDVTDEAALAMTNFVYRDLCVCAIGNEGREVSIIATALLRQFGAKRLVACVSDPLHEWILCLIGAHEVINLEKAFGERFATRVLYTDVIDEIPLGRDLMLTELNPPDVFVGRTLAELGLPRKYEVTVVAVRRPDRVEVELPTATRRLEADDVLIVVARPGSVARLLEKLS